MDKNKFVLPQGILYVSDLPSFIGVKPYSVGAHRFYGDEENKGYAEYYEVSCDFYSNNNPKEDSQIIANRRLLLSLEQVKEFEDALYVSETGIVLIQHNRGNHVEFSAGNCFSRGTLGRDFQDIVHTDSVNYRDLPWWKKVLAFPDELGKILTDLRLMCETHRTVKNIIEVNYEKSSDRSLRCEVSSMRSTINKLKDDNHMLRLYLKDLESEGKAYEVVQDKLYEAKCKEVERLTQQLINQEESVLREAEKIKSRINAEEQSKI